MLTPLQSYVVTCHIGTPIRSLNLCWQLLRCAPHHVRQDFRSVETSIGGLEAARQAVASLKSRGVTRFTDLSRLNKRNIDEVDDDEEAMDDGSDGPVARRPRLDVGELGARPTGWWWWFRLCSNYAWWSSWWSVVSTFACWTSSNCTSTTKPDQVEIDTERNTPADTPLDGMEILDQLELEDEPEPGVEPYSAPPSVRSRSIDGPAEPAPQSSAPVHTLAPEISALYEPAGPEDFRTRRSRIDRQETHGPHRPIRPQQPTVAPYQPPNPDGRPDPEERELYSQAFVVSELDSSALPPGWTFDEAGYLQLSGRCSDFWQVQSGCLIRHHVQPRHNLYFYEKDKDAPIVKEYLDPVRITVMRLGNGQIEVVNDSGDRHRACQSSWTGCTVFQINGKARKELCMCSNMPAKKIAKDEKSTMVRQQKKIDKGGMSERHLTLEQKLQFQAAKQKELRSFFENQVWEFDSAQNSDPARTMTARMLLKWSKNEDGTPRAKARLIVRGYSDVDALQGTLETSSPTTTRLSRNMLLSLSTVLRWQLWTSDIATAFLQGLPQERKLWVKLPAECLKLLGAEEDTRMLLVKPVYGQLDAPRRWYLEAVRRLRALGLRQHLLDYIGGSNLWTHFWWLTLCGLAFLAGYFLQWLGERRRLRLVAGRLTSADRTASAMSILVPKLQESLEQAQSRIARLQSAYEEASDNYDRIAQAYNDAINQGGETPIGFRTAFTELNELRGLRDDAIRGSCNHWAWVSHGQRVPAPHADLRDRSKPHEVA